MADPRVERTFVISLKHSLGIAIEDLIDILNRTIEIDFHFVVKEAHIVLGNEVKLSEESE